MKKDDCCIEREKTKNAKRFFKTTTGIVCIIISFVVIFVTIFSLVFYRPQKITILDDIDSIEQVDLIWFSMPMDKEICYTIDTPETIAELQKLLSQCEYTNSVKHGNIFTSIFGDKSGIIKKSLVGVGNANPSNTYFVIRVQHKNEVVVFNSYEKLFVFNGHGIVFKDSIGFDDEFEDIHHYYEMGCNGINSYDLYNKLFAFTTMENVNKEYETYILSRDHLVSNGLYEVVDKDKVKCQGYL